MGAWEKRQAGARRRRELRERAVAYLGGKCSICSYSGCASAFDFHHVELWLKDFTISDRMTSWARIEPELKKVELLCCRCHREVHDGLHPGHIEHEPTNKGGWGDDRQLDLWEGVQDYLSDDGEDVRGTDDGFLGGTVAQTSSIKVTKEQRAWAIQARFEGQTFQRIATVLNISVGHAHRLCSLLDPSVTPEQIREAMEAVPPSPEVTPLDMLQRVG